MLRLPHLNSVFLPALALLWIGIGCQQQQAKEKSHLSPFNIQLPDHFPPIPVPADNPLTVERVELGRKLFYEPLLSLDSSVACVSCHRPALAFTDSVMVSAGAHGRTGFRNAPTLTNVAYNEHFFFDGGIPTLELQVLAPLSSEDEMALNIHQGALRLRDKASYRILFEKAFQRPPDSYGIIRALAAFERTLISYRSPYDRWKQGDSAALSPKAKVGMALFYSDSLQCSTCHAGFNFTHQGFEHNGLYTNYSSDPGRRRVTMDTHDIGKFKVPTLRNVAVTAPYMHDGSMATLTDVIRHYAAGGKPHPNKSPLIQGFSLSAEEEDALIAFLNSLTDSTFLNRRAYRPNEPLKGF